MEGTVGQHVLLQPAIKAVVAAVEKKNVGAEKTYVLVFGSRIVKNFETKKDAKDYMKDSNLVLVYCDVTRFFSGAKTLV